MRAILIKEEDLKGTIYENHFEQLKMIAEKRSNEMKYILDCVCSNYSIPIKDMLSSSKKKKTVVARHVFMFLAREINIVCGLRYKNSFSEIGNLINRDHASVIFGVNKVKDLINKKDFREDLRLLIDSIFGQSGLINYDRYLKREVIKINEALEFS